MKDDLPNNDRLKYTYEFVTLEQHNEAQQQSVDDCCSEHTQKQDNLFSKLKSYNAGLINY